MRATREDALNYLDALRHRFHLITNVDWVVLYGDPVRQIGLEAEARIRPLIVMAIEPGGSKLQPVPLVRVTD